MAKCPDTPRQPRLVCLGELLVDMVPQGDRAYLWAAGGAPANVAVAAHRLGLPSAVVAAVGDDPFGRALTAELSACGVDVSGVQVVPRPTAVAFVTLGPAGERGFAFYGDDPAHDHLEPAAAAEAVARLASAGGGQAALHFGSVCLAREPSRSATLAAVAAARSVGALVSCDVNLRERFWSSPDEARSVVRTAVALADVVKASEEEAAFLAGAGEERLVGDLLRGGARLVVVSRGPAGATAYAPGFTVDTPAPHVDCLDTTGAGDALTAAVLASLLTEPEAWGDAEGAEPRLARACAYAALSTTRHGAIPSYPTLEELRTHAG